MCGTAGHRARLFVMPLAQDHLIRPSGRMRASPRMLWLEVGHFPHLYLSSSRQRAQRGSSHPSFLQPEARATCGRTKCPLSRITAEQALQSRPLPGSPEASEVWGASAGPGHRCTEWGCGMVKDKTLVPWGTVPVWRLWLGCGGSEYRFTCQGKRQGQSHVRGGANPLKRPHLPSHGHSGAPQTCL